MRRFRLGSDFVASGNWTICTFDPQGSVAQRLNTSQSITSSSYYDAYGQEFTSGSPSDPFGYNAQSGYYVDRQTGKYLLGHRYYDWSAGRFLTRDPIGYEGGLNLYRYCLNHPTTDIDPTGEASVVRVNPWYMKYDHAFLWLNKPCLGQKSFGFWPRLDRPIGWDRFNCGYEGQVVSPDKHDIWKGDLYEPGELHEHQTNNDDPEFEDELCACISKSMRHPPVFTVGSVCGTWANSMWRCARNRYWRKKGQLWRAFLSESRRWIVAAP